MKIVITHTDLRLYWPARIAALQKALEKRGHELHTVEIAGAGSPYGFSGLEQGSGNRGNAASYSACLNPGPALVRNWTCLFPSSRMEDIPAHRACRALLASLDKLAPDVVMAGSIAYPSGAASVYWAKANRRPVIIFDDAKPTDVPRNRLVNYIKQLIYNQVDAILCPALPWQEGFLRWKFRPEQLFYGVDVVDNEFWSKGGSGGDGHSHGPNDSRSDGRYGIANPLPVDPLPLLPDVTTPFLLAVGRQIPAKNFMSLLEAYEQYQKLTEPNVRLPLVFVGDGPERKSMEWFIRTMGMDDVYLLPFVKPRTLRKIYHRAGALVLPSKSETWGLVVNEAMAAGLPVLVSKACGCASVLVEEGVNGYTFDPTQENALLKLLTEFTKQDSHARAAMGRASEERIKSWGLDQFVIGSMQAIDYSLANRKICGSMKARLVLKNWKGRYRPV